ncbi:RNA 3'-terminal phosphate cyclase-like protein [Plecturocebus cupreus]
MGQRQTSVMLRMLVLNTWAQVILPTSAFQSSGITDFEASFIRLLDKITNGSRIEINQTGELVAAQS